MNLADRLVAIHEALDAGGVPHAFGGALALAWCTARPRDDTLIGVFFSTTSFHDAAQERVQIKYFAGSGIPFLACRDLAVSSSLRPRYGSR